MIAALYVAKGGCYFGLPDVDPWDEERDARKYAGPWPVVAHPPCQRWGRYWSGGPMLARTTRAKKLGDDGGCFAAALASVRRFGGVLEHPEASHAWRWFGLNIPPRSGSWVNADFLGGWTCCVEQGHYGHPARKATWLYAFNVRLPLLRWGKSNATKYLGMPGVRSTEHARMIRSQPDFKRPKITSSKENLATPIPFRDLLVSIARSSGCPK